MWNKQFVRKTGKKVLTMSLGAAMVGSMMNVVPPMEAQAAYYSIEEDFDEYSSANDKQGNAFGSPVFALTDHDEGKALAVTGRSNGWDAYALNVNAFKGNTIHLLADLAAYNAEAGEETTFDAKIKIEKSGEEDQYLPVATGTAVGAEYITLEGDYEIPTDCDTCTIYFETVAGVDYAIDNISITPVGDYVDVDAVQYVDTSEYAVLKDLYADDFKMGVACEAISHWGNDKSEIGNPNKEALMKQTFNSITFGNELKPDYNMDYHHSTETDLLFEINPAAKEMLDWAKNNEMPVRGHTLVWHSQCPDQIFCKDYNALYADDENTVLMKSCLVDKETLKLRMKSYINHVMEYMYANGYGDVIYAWDVVNEAIEPGTNADNMRNSYWYQIIGDEFLMDAFQYTREAVEKYSAEYASVYEIDAEDETALKAIQPKLFYNDYNEFQASKRDAIIDAVKPIKEAGYIDGIGMQAHLKDTTKIADFTKALKMYSDAVGEVHITELDVEQTASGVKAEYYQGLFYNDLFKALVEANKDGANLTAVTIWGITDDNSWKKESSPLLFNADLSKKLAFDGIVNAKTGAAMPEPTFTEVNYKDGLFGFDGEDEVPSRLGFASRNDATLEIQDVDSYTGSQSLLVTDREDLNGGLAFDVSRFAGQTISVSAWVRSEDSEVAVITDDDSLATVALADTSSGEWVQLMGTYTVPKENVPKLFFATAGTADFYVDAVEIKMINFEEGFEGSSHIVNPRGVGHMPHLSLVEDTVASGTKALRVTRDEQEASVRFDVSKYAGSVIDVRAQVKTTDEIIRMGLDGDTPTPLVEVDSQAGFTEVHAKVMIPADETSSAIYIETSGTADFYVDDICISLADTIDGVEGDDMNFRTRWGGAGSIEVAEGEGVAGSNAVHLYDKDATYYGIVYDVSSYLGMQVEISFDVKTDDEIVKLSGDIDGSWPNYMTAETNPGEYTHVGCVVNLPNDLSALKVYVETNGTSDIYLDNFSIKRVPYGEQHRVSFASDYDVELPDTQVVTDDNLVVYPGEMTKEGLIFKGWYSDEALTNQWNMATDRVTADTTLYAAFEIDMEPVLAAEELIDQILDIDPEGEIPLDDEEKMDAVWAAAEAFDALADVQKEALPEDKVNAYLAIIKAVSDAQIKNAKDLVEELKTKLDNNTLTTSDEDVQLVNDAISAFYRLKEEQKNTFDNFDEIEEILDAAKTRVEDLTAKEMVEKLINDIGEVSPNSYLAIKEARKWYDMLTDEQKTMLDPQAIITLTNAEKEYSDIETAQAVTLKVESLPDPADITLDSEFTIKSARDMYNKLTPNQKKYVTALTVETLTAAEKKYNDLKAAKDVTDMILAIKDVKADDKSKKAIDDAKAAYEELTEDQKVYVKDETVDALNAAEATYKQAVADEEEKAAEEKAKQDKENKDKEAVANVEELIGKVKVTDKASIDAARNAYDALTPNQKKLVNPDLLKGLTNAEDAYKSLEEGKKPASSEETDDTSNVTVSKVKSVKVSKKKAGVKTKLTVKYKKINGCKYEIQISTDKKFKNKKVTKKLTAKANKTKVTYSKNFKGKTVYVRVRAYKTINGKKVYGKWSTKKKIKSYK